MSLQLLFKYESLDSTEFLNRRLQALIGRGVYSGGLLYPQSGLPLRATRDSFLAVGYDGTTVYDLSTQVVQYTAGQDNYHCILAKYNPLGTPATPTLSELVLTASSYNSHADKLYLILLAVVSPPGGATELLSSHISYTQRDEITPVGRSTIRGTVASTGYLPIGTPSPNRVGDCYLVIDKQSFYTWNGSVWVMSVARGSGTLDGDYDDAAGSGVPGAGRQIWVDAGAVELIGSDTTMRTDIASATLRIDKRNISYWGTVSIDVLQLSQYNKASGGTFFVRELINDLTTTVIIPNEPVDMSAGAGGPINLTRVGANLNGLKWGGNGKAVQLVEISGSAIGNNGLYLVTVTGDTTATLQDVNSAAPTLAAEPGLTANFFYVRTALGGTRSYWAVQDMATYRISNWQWVGSFGQLYSGQGWIGGVTAWTQGSIDTIHQWWDHYQGGKTLKAEFKTIGNALNGTGDSLTKSGSTITMVDAGTSFPSSSDVVGKTITISGASNSGNNGTFVVTVRLSATSVQWENASGATETSSFTWSWQGYSPSFQVYGGYGASQIHGRNIGTGYWDSGIRGESTDAAIGIRSTANTHFAGYFYSTARTAIYAETGSTWLYAASHSKTSGTGPGVYGENLKGTAGAAGEQAGVSGYSVKGPGVKGISAATSEPGVHGENTYLYAAAPGVKGVSVSPLTAGVEGTNNGTGVWGKNQAGNLDGGYGVRGESTGIPIWNGIGDSISVDGDGLVTVTCAGSDLGSVTVGYPIEITGATSRNNGIFTVMNVAPDQAMFYNPRATNETSSFTWIVYYRTGAAGVLGHSVPNAGGIVGTSDSGVGVLGSTFAHIDGLWTMLHVPLTAGQPMGWAPSSSEYSHDTWEFDSYSGEPSWLFDTSINPGYSYPIHFVISDFPDNCTLHWVQAVVSGSGSPTITMNVDRYSLDAVGTRTWGGASDSASATAGSRATFRAYCYDRSLPSYAYHWTNLRRSTSNTASGYFESDYIQVSIWPTTNTTGKFYRLYGIQLAVSFKAVSPFVCLLGSDS